MTESKEGSLKKYYVRRIVTMFLIASPCYIWSQTIVLLAFLGIAYVLPAEPYMEDTDTWVMSLQLAVWVTMFVIGWFGSKLLIVKPKITKEIII